MKLTAGVAFAALLAVGADAERNLAFRRAAYQSSSADFDHVAHLVTDGSLAGRDWMAFQVSTRDAAKSPAGEGPDCAFDGDPRTKWLDFARRSWLQVTFAQPVAPAGYALTSANDDPLRDPKEWRLLGSDDGVNFTLVDERRGETFPKRFLRRAFEIRGRRAYRHFRLEMLNSGDSGSAPEHLPRLQIAEFDLLDRGQSLLRKTPPEGYESIWMSRGAKDEWVSVDLGTASAIDRVKLDWCACGFATDYAVQVSDDAAVWRTVATKADGRGGHEEVAFTRTTARYVRLLCQATAASRFALAELQVMGTNGLQPVRGTDNWRVRRASEVLSQKGTPGVRASGEELSSGGYDDSAWLPAVVPGTVLTSYFRAGAIPDMNIAGNQLMISEKFFTSDFWYRNTFRIAPPKRGERTWLNFGAVNWKADVYLNGRRLGSIDGAFLRRSFDISDVADFAGENHLAVFIRGNANPGKVTVQDLGSPGKNGGVLGRDNPTIHASIGWDWMPTVRGRNVGIYRDVTVARSGDVTLANGWAITELDVARHDFSNAAVTLRVRARNAAAKPVTAVIRGTVEPGGYVVTSEPFALAAGEEREVTVGAFTMANPRLWWPATYGAQPLYRAKLVASVDGAASQEHAFSFGVRKFTYRREKPMTIYCNGTRIVCRGGNWGMDDANLAATPADYDTKVRLHAEANLNMIRNWVGMTNSDDFYRACDKYGVLVWDDFWLANPGDGPNPADPAMFLANARDKVLRVRHHAALALWCGRNEGNPPPSLHAALPRLVGELDGTRHYIPDSAAGTVSGHGPYGVRNPEWYFKNAPVTLHSERGQPNIPELDSLRRLLGADHLWPIDDMWGLHDFTLGGAQRGGDFLAYLRQAYGEPQDLASFTRFAQFVAYENHKAMFESVYAAGGNGLLMWMSQSAWPSLVWQTYDYWHDVNGGYWGAKVGNQPVNVILNPATGRFIAVNATAEPFDGAAAVEFFDAEGRALARRNVPLKVARDSRQELDARQLPEGTDGFFFVRATVVSRAGRKLAENFTWLNTHRPHDYRALARYANAKPDLRDVRIDYRSLTRTVDANPCGASLVGAGKGATGAVTLVNATGGPVLLARVRLVDARGERVLPVHWSENYVSLMPGESRRIEFDAPDVNAAFGALKLTCGY